MRVRVVVQEQAEHVQGLKCLIRRWEWDSSSSQHFGLE